MTTTLTDARENVCDALDGLGGVTVYSYNPETLAAPAAVVLPGDPYLASGEDGVPYGWHRVRHTIIVVAAVASNEVATETLDSLIGDAIQLLGIAGYDVETVTEPYAFSSNGNLHLAADLTVSDTLQLL